MNSILLIPRSAIILHSSKILSNLIILDETETNHCMNVLRYKVGDTIYVVDGMGSLYTSKIVELKNNECCSKIINRKNSYNNQSGNYKSFQN